jgi:hypothetical protein
MRALLRRREIALWALCFIAVSFLLVATAFTSDDPDSALYAALSARLAEGPPARWIAPEWWGEWDSEGLFREHPAGVFLLPAMLGAMGVPGVQAAYIVGIGAGLASVVLIALLGARVTGSPADGRLLLVLLQLMPLAFIFRIRANHEYPMLVCLLVAILGADAVRRSWRWIWLMPLALGAAVLVKAAFVAIPLLAIGWWAIANPTRVAGSIWRPIGGLAVSAAAIIVMAFAYEWLYVEVAGESFWGGYWARQMAPLTIGASPASETSMLYRLGFYALRMLWHPAPWSFALIAAWWVGRGGWSELSPSARRGLVFCLGFAASSVLLLVPASRFAERYIFSANYALAAAGILAAAYGWPAFRAAFDRLDRRVPALPALCWTLLMLMRLVIGPFLPRISS